MSKSSAERQRDYRQRLKRKNLVQITAFVHSHQEADLRELLDRLRADPALEAGPLRHTASGKLQARRGR